MKKKIRVLHTEWSDGWGGQEIRIINEMIALREQGVEVFLACTNHAQIKQKAVDNDIKVFTLPFRGNADFKTLFGIKKIIQENKIDIVNTHSGKDTWVGGLAAKLAGAKFIRTRHLSNPIKSSRSNFINELADYIFTTGETVRSDMINNNRIKPERIQSIPTGIDADIYDSNNFNRQTCRELFQFKDDQIVIGIIAVLRQFKRHDRFLDMVRNVIDNNPEKNIHFVMAGDGPQREKLSNMINDLGLQGHVSMLGHVSNVPELLQALDVFVLTSDSGEGVPQSVMQALLMNTAVVSTSAGSTKDLHHDKNFILIDKDDQNELNTACTILANDSIMRKEYAQKSRDYVLDNFSKVEMTKKIMKVYRDLTRE
jgi:glycosyltransferase involved in cell wall biosynthesis